MIIRWVTYDEGYEIKDEDGEVIEIDRSKQHWHKMEITTAKIIISPDGDCKKELSLDLNEDSITVLPHNLNQVQIIPIGSAYIRLFYPEMAARNKKEKE